MKSAQSIFISRLQLVWHLIILSEQDLPQAAVEKLL